jgi:hypothetical protein
MSGIAARTGRRDDPGNEDSKERQPLLVLDDMLDIVEKRFHVCYFASLSFSAK